MAVKKRKFWADVSIFNDQWIHLVLNYIGPNSGQGIQAFKDGVLISQMKSGSSGIQTDGVGRVVVGRRLVSRNQDYAQVEVDELIFFNQALSAEEVRDLYNLYQ